MNILLYIPYINKKAGGVLQYSKCLLNTLAEDTTNTYYVFLRGNYDEFAEFVNNPRLRVLPMEETDYRSSLFSPVDLLRFNLVSLLDKLRIPHSLKRPDALARIIAHYRIDILHVPYQFMPAGLSIPGISTLHDIQEVHFPEYFSDAERKRREARNRFLIEQAACIVVSYQHIKDDIVRYYHRAATDIHVVLLNMQNLWFDKFLLPGYEVKKLTGLPEAFLLYPAATWEHKNHENLFKAIAFLRQTQGLNIPLVCSGHRTDYFYNVLQPIMDGLGIRDQVWFLGEVDEDTLFLLYRNCRAVIVPTRYEAGSFPLMESILLGVPCVCSNVTSLPETMGNDAYLFDPLSIGDMAFRIRDIMFDEAYRSACIENHTHSAKKITDTKSLDKFLYIYTSVIT